MSIDAVFSSDEMQVLSVNSHWSREELLKQEGIFFLKDIGPKLNISSNQIKTHAAALNDPWQEMGARKLWTHWIVRMIVFSDFYRKHMVSQA